MSTPANTSFQLWKGDTLRFTMTLKNSGSAYSIPGDATFTGTVTEKNSTNTYDLQTVITSASTGIVTVTLPATTSDELAANKNWIYDVKLTTASIVTTLLYGNLFVTDAAGS
jgi:hypothetical protein